MPSFINTGDPSRDLYRTVLSSAYLSGLSFISIAIAITAKYALKTNAPLPLPFGTNSALLLLSTICFGAFSLYTKKLYNDNESSNWSKFHAKRDEISADVPKFNGYVALYHQLPLDSQKMANRAGQAFGSGALLGAAICMFMLGGHYVDKDDSTSVGLMYTCVAAGALELVGSAYILSHLTVPSLTKAPQLGP